MAAEESTPRPAEAMRLRVRPDAFYVRHGDGVWLRNNLGSFSIQGEGAYHLIASLFTALDGRRTLAEIVDGLPAAARSSVLRLVSVLRRNGFLKEVDFPPEVVPEWMARLYPSHLAFLDQHADRPVARMMLVRSRPTVCLGQGTALRAVLGALGEFGVANVLVVSTGVDLAAVTDVIDAARARDPRLRWRTVVLDAPLAIDEAVHLIEAQQAALVLLAVDNDDHRAVADAQRALRRFGPAVGVLARCGDFVVSMPSDPSAEHCWECVSRSFTGSVIGDAADTAPALTPAVIGALGLVQHGFARLADVELDGRGTVTSIEPLAPVVRTHTAHRHPLCPRHTTGPVRTVEDWSALAGEPVRPDVPASQDSAELVAVSDRITAVLTSWTDQVTGPLLRLGEGDEDQLPLAASGCRVPDPYSRAHAPIARAFTCRAVSPREARNQVALFALEWLAERVAQPRGSTAVAAEEPASVNAGEPVPADVDAPATVDADAPVCAYGAGWSPAEAAYRAVVALSTRVPVEPPAWAPVEHTSDSAGPVRDFLVATLAAAGRQWQATALQSLPTGLVRAEVRAGDLVRAGIGIGEAHATDNALLAAVVATRPGARSIRVAHLRPPVDDWAEAVAVTAKHEGDIELVDISSRLPFLGGRVTVIRARLLPGGPHDGR